MQVISCTVLIHHVIKLAFLPEEGVTGYLPLEIKFSGSLGLKLCSSHISATFFMSLIFHDLLFKMSLQQPLLDDPFCENSITM